MQSPRSIVVQRAGIHFRWEVVGLLLGSLAFLLFGLWRITFPATSWDEGWTMTVARTWVERGIYGRLLNGQVVAGGVEAAFPTTASVALSFKVFGVGLWQGRLPGLMYAMGAMGIIYYLARELYDRKVALGTLAVLLLTSSHSNLHPLIMGRLVLAEMPLLFFLVLGYLCFLLSLRRSLWFLPLAVVFWGIALITKAQPLPFWLCSMLVPLCYAALRRQWRLTGVLVASLIGSLVLWQALPVLFQWLLQERFLPRSTVHGLYDVTAFVPVWRYRILGLQVFLITALPVLLGLCYATWLDLFRKARVVDTARDVVSLALIAFCGSWCAWFVLLSLGHPRYLFPAVFVGSIFTSVLLRDLTHGWSLPRTVQGAMDVFHRRTGFRKWAGAWLVIILLALSVPQTMTTLTANYTNESQATVSEVVQYLNAQTPPDALIESYQAELFFYLDRRYHYPPDQYHVDLLQRTVRSKPLTTTYDPLSSGPDYVVADMQGDDWRAYESLATSPDFELIERIGYYDIFARVK